MRYDIAPTSPLEFADWLEMVAEDLDNSVLREIRRRMYRYSGDGTNVGEQPYMSFPPSTLRQYAKRIRARVPEIIAEKLTQ